MSNGNITIGICKDCVHHSVIKSSKGSEFHLCEYSKKDSSFPKYPRLPVMQCKAFTSAKTAKEREENELKT